MYGEAFNQRQVMAKWNQVVPVQDGARTQVDATGVWEHQCP
jgi:hypothetical protein